MTLKNIAGISISAVAAMMFAASASAHDGMNVATGHGGKLVDSWGNCIISKSGNDLCSPEPVCKEVETCRQAPVTINKSMNGDTNFGFDKSNLTAEGEATLTQLVGAMKGVNVRSVSVTGHTDAVGSEAYNQGLSERRAATVASFLTANGVNGAVISAKGMGESQATQPASASNAARMVDRRVDIVVSGTTTGGGKQVCTKKQVCEEKK
jgi:outer membrane protein OmpA-like peptidoglycan-associated protein